MNIFDQNFLHLSVKSLQGLFLCTLLVACKPQPHKEQMVNNLKLNYPTVFRSTVEETYFGKTLKDPYRWLEDLNSKETVEWVAAQNSVTFDYLNHIPFRREIRERVEKLWNYEKYSLPFQEGGLYFFYKNNGLQNQSVLYMQRSLTAEPEVLLDPNTLSTDGTVALSMLRISKDGKYLAYAISRSGSDWQEIYVLDIASKTLLADKIEWAKFSSIAWRKDGFYYSRFDAPTEGKEHQNANYYHKVYYHQVGNKQSQDELVYEDKNNKEYSFGASVSEDEKTLILSAWKGTSGNKLYMKDLEKSGSSWVTIVDDFKNDNDIIGTIGNDLLMMTNSEAPNMRLVRINAKNPTQKDWVTIIPEQKNTLRSVTQAGKKLFASYIENAKSKIVQYSEDGKQEKEVELPAIGTAVGFEGKAKDKEIFYLFTSYTFPTTIYRYSIATGKSTIFRQATLDFQPENYETKQVFYTSKDHTKVSMFIVHKKGIVLDNSNPTYLYAYGGFNVSQVPMFNIKYAAWLENGGILAIPNLRGGGEYGESWHKGGMLDKKQNVFDDFIAAAEYLIAQKYTSKEKLAVAGGSNGGLLIGATITQRPDLCKVALPAVGVLDMLRFHKFTIGRAWITEYGCADSTQKEFETLYAYSPLHNIKKSVNYPATLVITADHDDRVVPSHSFKFISELQANHEGTNPILIRIDVKAGHGAGKPTSKQIDEWADVMAFTLFNLGADFKVKTK
jgi:prolyl oligopeptidase